MTIQFHQARQARILNLLMQSSHPLTSQYFASYFNISTRLIRYDIQDLKHQLQHYPCQLLSIKGVGYQLQGDIQKLQLEIKKELGELYYYDNIDTKDKFIREQLILRYILLKNTIVTTKELTEHFYITRATLKEDITRAAETIEPYHMSIHFIPYKGVYLQGSEVNKRMLLARETAFYKNSPLLTYLRKELNFIPFHFEDFIEFIHQHFQIMLSHVEAYNLYIHVWIMFYRVWKHHYVDVSLIKDNPICQPYIAIFEQWLSPFTNDFQFPQQEIYYLALLIFSSGPHSYFPHLIDGLSSLISQLEKQTHFTFHQSFYQQLSTLFIPIFIKSQNQICSNSIMIREIKKKSPLSIDLAYRLSAMVKERYHVDLFDNDICAIAYLVFHQLNQIHHRKVQSVIVTTSIGFFLSQDLLFQLQNRFPHVHFIYKELYELHHISLENIIFIISDTFIETRHIFIPIIKINLMYNETNMQRIAKYIALDHQKRSQRILSHLQPLTISHVSDFLHMISVEFGIDEQWLQERENKITFETNKHCVIICDYHPSHHSCGWYHQKGLFYKNAVIHYFFYINILSSQPFDYQDIENYLYQIDDTFST